MLSSIILSLLLFTSLSSPILKETSLKSTRRDTDSSWDYLGVTGYAGYITMNPLTGSSLFYWLFESINSNITTDTKPLIIWLQGGPGCSGSSGMLWEMISPIQINSNAQPLRTNTNNTWTTSYHVMSIDFPYGVGYSFANSASDERFTTQEATYYLYRFLYKLWVKYPVWFNRNIFVFGERYGGHWVPGLAWNILQQNALNNGFNVQLKGIGIGDPWVDPATQSQGYASYAYTTSLINSNEVSVVSYYENLVTSYLASGNLLQANTYHHKTVDTVQDLAGGVNKYNMRFYHNYNDNGLFTFMNKASTKSLLHVGNKKWSSCNDTVHTQFNEDFMNGSAIYLPFILEQGVSLIVYTGQDDLLVNLPGVENMIANIKWPGAVGFANANRLNWYVEGNIAGYVQSYQNLTFVAVLKAGHMAPYDQPVNVKNMVERFVNGTGWS